MAASAMPFTDRCDRIRFARGYYGMRRIVRELHDELKEVERLAMRFQRHEAQRIKMNDRFDLWNQVLNQQNDSEAVRQTEPV